MPETKGLELEALDAVFNGSSREQAFTYVDDALWKFKTQVLHKRRPKTKEPSSEPAYEVPFWERDEDTGDRAESPKS